MTVRDTRHNTFETSLADYNRRATRHPKSRRAAELLGYTAAAGGMAFAGGDAMGAIIHHTAPLTFTVGTYSSQLFSVDLDGAGGADWGVFLRMAASYYGSAKGDPVFGASTVANIPSSYASALNLGAGFQVGPTLASGVWNNGNPSGVKFFEYFAGNFPNGSTGYLGVNFQGDTGSSGTQYGWIKVKFDLQPDSFLSATIFEWAFDDSGAAIGVGQVASSGSGGGTPSPVPEPGTGSLALLGLGAAGLLQFRRRRDEGLKRLIGKSPA